jgi:hypothetical protein
MLTTWFMPAPSLPSESRSPASRLRCDVLLGGVLEGHRLGRSEHPFEAAGLAHLDRIVAGIKRGAAFEGALPGGRQADRVGRSQAVVVQLAVTAKAEDPGARQPLADHEIEAAAVVMPARPEPD